MVRIPAFHAGGPGSIPGVGAIPFVDGADGGLTQMVERSPEPLQMVYVYFDVTECHVDHIKRVVDRQVVALPEPGIEPGTFRSSV